MKFLLLLLLTLFFSCYSYSQTMVDVATGEYSVKWIKSDGTVWTPFETVYNTTVVTQQLTGLTGILKGDGGQYHSILLKNDGTVYDSRINLKTFTAYTVDNLGNPFTADKVYAFWRQNLAIKAGEVYYWSGDNGGTGEEDILRQFGTLTTDVPAPRKLIQPVGKTITKLIHGSSISPYDGAKLWGLASDGTLWQWSVSVTTPVQVLGKAGFPGTTWTGTVVDAAMIGPSANIVVTSTNQVWAWGYGSHIIGGFDDWQNLTMTNITSNMTGAGIVFPLKQLTANYLTAYVIDANDNMFAIGNNQTGTVGDGYMTPSWRTHYNGTSSHVYAFDFNMDHGSQLTWKQVPGKWSNIKTNATFVFYAYGQDMSGNWYSWGRAKAKVLGNGKTWGSLDQANYPEWLDIPAPRLVSPVTDLSWTLTPTDGTLNPATARLPIANAGINQYPPVSTTSVTLYGTGSHQQQPTNTTTVTMTNNWTRVSGPNTPTITTPTSQNTTVTGMIAGTYVFRNTVTNSVGATDFQEVSVVIPSSSNVAPIVNAGLDQTITLPTSSVNVTAVASDPDGSITTYLWEKVSGTGGVITSTSTATTSITGLTAGSYVYKVTVTDNGGATTIDQLTITVNEAPIPTNTIRNLIRFKQL